MPEIIFKILLTEKRLCAIVINAVKQQSRVSTLTLARLSDSGLYAFDINEV